MDDLIVEFLTETNESLGELDLDLVRLEQNPNDKDLLSKIFRLMHTIKGTCGFLSLPRLETVAHRAENVLGKFRDGELAVTPEYVTLILESIDRIKYIISAIEQNGAEPDGDNMDLIVKLDAVYEGTAMPAAAVAPAAPAVMEPEAATEPVTAADEPDQFPEEDPVPAPQAAADPHADKTAVKESALAAQTLRVGVDVIENLMTMVSELVLTRNQLLQILRAQKESEFTTPLQRLNHVVSDLQEGVMKTRMQPIGNAWSKLPRIIRDISHELGKKIELEMLGQDTELDRQVLEMIKDPLTHMVRNSADHGIETPAERVKAGKPETGRVLLNAYHEGGHIIIEISDDGKGLSTERIKKKILEKNLATAAELETMGIQQIHQFIFNAGFSTAEKVTSVSGRGVGMDVVRTNIEKIGGSIELKSVEGKGSKFLIKIPLTLAIISALIVESGKERFAIPQLAVRELVKAGTDGDNRIETIKGAPVFRLRNHLLPLVPLSGLLKLDDPADAKGGKVPPGQYIVVTQVGAYVFGILVDKVFDTEEIVVKPVAKILKNIELFSGNTILGDGSVIMILDPGGIAKASGESAHSDSMDAAAEEAARRSGPEKTSLLLFAAGPGAPKAVPLSLVARLEQIKVASIEMASDQMLIQYREQLMPLIPFDSRVSVEGASEKPVLVFSDSGRWMGLIVDEIIDITEEHINIQMQGTGKGIMGSAIINGKATDVVDVGYFLRSVSTDWFKNHGDEPFGSSRTNGNGSANGHAGARRVLLVDDSPFFRNMLTPLLSMAGYRVTTLESPLQALKMCEAGEQFDVIVSDIEMPEMDGFEFAEKVKESAHWSETPMVALTSHATPQDIERGRSVGFDRYIAKFDRETLLNTLSQTLANQAVHGQHPAEPHRQGGTA